MDVFHKSLHQKKMLIANQSSISERFSKLFLMISINTIFEKNFEKKNWEKLWSGVRILGKFSTFY